ncbi:hypothetical protein [Octadecabacter arcticus]|uniref:hypothetical protein n=1 Tax=Octadecabacter arcticus TaxID=53946 RepID=UPI00018091AD|nr:hypothetical protein [Octadecabacter arcticus]
MNAIKWAGALCAGEFTPQGGVHVLVARDGEGLPVQGIDTPSFERRDPHVLCLRHDSNG